MNSEHLTGQDLEIWNAAYAVAYVSAEQRKERWIATVYAVITADNAIRALHRFRKERNSSAGILISGLEE